MKTTSFFLRPWVRVVAVALTLPALAATEPARAQTPDAPAANGPAAPPQPSSPQPSASQAAPAPAEQAARPAGETPAVVIDAEAADTLLGKPVQSATGEDMGRIVDVIVDRAGTMRAVVIDFGGFLGVGSRKIAVDWRVLHFPEKGGLSDVVAGLSGDQLRVAPVYKPGEPVVVIGRADSPPASPAPAPASQVQPDPAPPAPETATPAPAAPQP